MSTPFPNYRYLEPHPRCEECGRPSVGVLRDFADRACGAYCLPCATRRLTLAAQARRAKEKKT